jgi:hypothetical protein
MVRVLSNIVFLLIIVKLISTIMSSLNVPIMHTTDAWVKVLWVLLSHHSISAFVIQISLLFLKLRKHLVLLIKALLVYRLCVPLLVVDIHI